MTLPAANEKMTTEKKNRKSPWKIECFLEDLLLGSQWSIILGYRRLSDKFLGVNLLSRESFPKTARLFHDSFLGLLSFGKSFPAVT